MRDENRNNQIVCLFDAWSRSHYEVLELVLGFIYFTNYYLKILLKLLGLTAAKYSSIWPY